MVTTTDETISLYREKGLEIDESPEAQSELSIQKRMALQPDTVEVQIQNIMRCRDYEGQEWLTYEIMRYVKDYYKDEHSKDDKCGCHTVPDTKDKHDEDGQVYESVLRGQINQYDIPFSPEAVDRILNLELEVFDKTDKEADWFKKRRLKIIPKIILRNTTKYYIAQTSTAIDRIAERPIVSVFNLDDFKYLPYNLLLTRGTAHPRGLLEFTAQPETAQYKADYKPKNKGK